jgi:alkanesulfonate monooxygenase SsuD/methylene tetrahydromethanopterin reductase-like flavin-dependent oxidoreductase (luciferase family)
VAQAAATLDRLSGGRLVLGVGAGGDRPDYEAFGEDWTSAVRVARMDEAVEIVDAFLRGESVTHAGPDFPIDGVGIGPRPAQQPRPPIWMGAFRPGGIRRAARWDGWIAVTTADDPRVLGMPPSGAGGARRAGACHPPGGRPRRPAVRRGGVRGLGPGRVHARRLRRRIGRPGGSSRHAAPRLAR